MICLIVLSDRMDNKEEQQPLLQLGIVREHSDVYALARNETSTSPDRDVLRVLKCPWKIEMDEVGYV